MLERKLEMGLARCVNLIKDTADMNSERLKQMMMLQTGLQIS